jgi:ketosteroid isomerase-like protein
LNKIFALVAVVMFIVIGNGTASAQTSKHNAAIEQEIRRLDLVHADAILRGDLAALDKIWTKDFRVNNPFNQVDQADRIRTGAVTYSSFLREPESVLVHGNTVIVMGREIVVPKGNSPDAGKTINRRYTNIWMKREGKWRLIARHASVICAK